jgi:hypothetical protein
MPKANFKQQSHQDTVEKAAQNVHQALLEIQGAIELLQVSTTQDCQAEALPENLEEVQIVLDRVIAEFQLLDQQLAAVVSPGNTTEGKLLDWFNRGERLKTSA